MSLFLTDNRLAHLLTLDHPNSSHLVLFNDTKTYCLLRNPSFGKAPLLLERSAGFAGVLLLCWQVQAPLERPCSLMEAPLGLHFPLLPLLIATLKFPTVTLH